MDNARAQPVEAQGELPETADVVIVGGGIVGVCTALELARRGVKVVLCEKGKIGGEASGRAVGWIDNQLFSPAKIEITVAAKRLWAKLAQELGPALGYRPGGLLTILPDAAARAQAQGWLAETAALQGVDAQLCTGSSLHALAPWAQKGDTALFQPSDASVEPKAAAPVIAKAARKEGAIILQNCAVRGLELNAGRVSGVVTEHGRVKCAKLVLTAGIWAPLFCKSLGLTLPQLKIFASVLRTGPIANGPAGSGSIPGVIWRPQDDGGYSVARLHGLAPITPDALRHMRAFWPAFRAMRKEVTPVLGKDFFRELTYPSHWSLNEPSLFEKHRVFAPTPRPAPLHAALAQLARSIPAFATAQIEEIWAGALMNTPDNMPVISTVPGREGLFLGTGFYYGLTMAPAAGQALAALSMGEVPEIDLTPFRFSRFSDGSRLTLQA